MTASISFAFYLRTLNHMFFSFAVTSARLLSYSMATWTPQYMNVRSTNSSTPEDFSRTLATKLFATYVNYNYQTIN